MAEDKKNTVSQIKDFFSTPDNPVKTSEMMTFWKSLTVEDKAYYTTVDLNG